MHEAGRPAQAVWVRSTFGTVGTAGIIQHFRLISAQSRLQQRDQLPLVDIGDRRIIIQIIDRCRRHQQFKTMLIDRQCAGQGPHIPDCNGQIFRLEKDLRLTACQGGAFKIRFSVLGHDKGQRCCYPIGVHHTVIFGHRRIHITTSHKLFRSKIGLKHLNTKDFDHPSIMPATV